MVVGVDSVGVEVVAGVQRARVPVPRGAEFLAQAAFAGEEGAGDDVVDVILSRIVSTELFVATRRQESLQELVRTGQGGRRTAVRCGARNTSRSSSSYVWPRQSSSVVSTMSLLRTRDSDSVRALGARERRGSESCGAYMSGEG